MEYSVYIIQSLKTGKRYIGSTRDIEKRLLQHNEGNTRSTRGKGPWKTIYVEDNYTTREEALCREKELKNMKGGIQLKILLYSFKNTRV